ncbi:MAG: stage 0 sporulation family protein [Firmicutes bacterium]|nr:stage 0 sporulation family protein [Bacillota bacterium]
MEEENTLNPTVEVADIQFRPGQKVYYFNPNGLQLHTGDHVIIDTARGVEFGYCAGANHRVRKQDVVAPLRAVIRLANARDERILQENREKEKRAVEVCQKKISDFGLDMQLVSTECAFDGSKLLFYFTADERVDFRELVKSLASTFHTRIELRQIGVRDKAKLVGGLGICGRPFCCTTFLDSFQPVSIKMAKTQNLSLNPTKISGTCGRLLCCLMYEQAAYEDLLRSSPKTESFVDTPDGRGTVVEVNLLSQKVRVQIEKNPETIVTAAVGDIAVFRSGKARKTDPPIPEDWAPISGSGERPKKEEEPVERLEPIKFRYREESVTDDPPAGQETPPAEPESQSAPRRTRRRRPPKPRSEADAASAEPKPESAPAAKRSRPYRPYRRGRKPKQES